MSGNRDSEVPGISGHVPGISGHAGKPSAAWTCPDARSRHMPPNGSPLPSGVLTTVLTIVAVTLVTWSPYLCQGLLPAVVVVEAYLWQPPLLIKLAAR